MPSDEFPSSWRDPDYVAAVVGVLAVGVLAFYSAFVPSAPPIGTVGFVLLWVFAPMTVAYEAARRWG